MNKIYLKKKKKRKCNKINNEKREKKNIYRDWDNVSEGMLYNIYERIKKKNNWNKINFLLISRWKKKRAQQIFVFVVKMQKKKIT